MSAWDHLAELRIREWLARPAAERVTTSPPLDPALPLEVQLMADIGQLDRMAASAGDADEATQLRGKADALMIRLLVLLETQGRPLAARHFAEQRRSFGG